MGGWESSGGSGGAKRQRRTSLASVSGSCAGEVVCVYVSHRKSDLRLPIVYVHVTHLWVVVLAVERKSS